ncbi:MAG: hypothetical protein CMI04_08790 [Oceanospirillaceae bacterium]|nr:hypothetical protein [Oceanospirillaceae bacterium]
MIALDSTSDNGLTLTDQAATPLARLRNAVLISLFTDARAPADQVPDGMDNRGFWADMDLPNGESLGSTLWTLQREKITAQLLTRLRDLATSALAWMIDDGQLQAVNVTVERYGLDGVAWQIDCQLPDNTWQTITAEQTGYGV